MEKYTDHIMVAVAACAGVLLLVVLAACSSPEQPLLFTATPEPTAGPDPDVEWIEYRNDEHGVALSHPADWSVAELPNRIIFAYPGSAVALRILVQRAETLNPF